MAKRGVGVVLGLIFLAVLVSVAGLVAMYLIVGREPSVGSNSTLVIRLDDDLPEVGGGGVVQQLLDGSEVSGLPAVLDALRKAKSDPRIQAVIIFPSGLKAPYWAKVQEVHDAVVDFRKSGKPALAFLEYAGEHEYLIASACSKIYLMPSAPLDLNGLASYELFLGGTLDKVGAYPDFLHIGDYKTALNIFTEKTFTPAHREMTESMTRDLYDQLVRASPMAGTRRKTKFARSSTADRSSPTRRCGTASSTS